MTQNDRQRTRRNLGEGGTPAQRARREQARERERRVEVLVAEILNILSQRDVLVAGLERRAGRCLAEIHDLGWPGPARTAGACYLSVREAARLRHLANDYEPNDSINRN
ncbi:hypothetical protein [uncultured Nocardioides sp.]|uniref:hypothetical protein n=1 Tax=uncultured Nocardioides sp. TaxID=198441 RepID=UPI0025D52BCA|nr:hypothetical protein [uncultured Nocardioides sp.]